MVGALGIYIVHADEDAELAGKLQRALSALCRLNLPADARGASTTVTVSASHKVPAGEHRVRGQQDALSRAHLVLLLLSSDFLASEDCNALHTSALQRQERKELRLGSIVGRPCLWESVAGAPRDLVLPADGRALSVRPENERDEALHGVALAVREEILAIWADRALPVTTREKLLDVAFPLLLEHTRHDLTKVSRIVQGLDRDGDEAQRLSRLRAGITTLLANAQNGRDLLAGLMKGLERPADRPALGGSEGRVLVLIEPRRGGRYGCVVLTLEDGGRASTVEAPEEIEAWTPEARQPLHDAILEAVRSLGYRMRTANIRIEFVLPRDLLCEEVECWRGDFDSLGRVHPTVVRSLERLLDRRFRGTWGDWRARWETHRGYADHPLCWIDRDHHVPAVPATAADHYCCVGLRAPVSPIPTPQEQDFFLSMIRSGVGVALWLRERDGAEEVEAVARDVFRGQMPADLPAKVLELRQAAREDPHAAIHRMTVFWDEPHPALLDWCETQKLPGLREKGSGT